MDYKKETNYNFSYTNREIDPINYTEFKQRKPINQNIVY